MPAPASMRPRQIRRGVEGDFIFLTGGTPASMRPRQIRRGVHVRPHGDVVRLPPGFNEAPADSPGSAGVAASRLPPDGRGFNEAPADSPGSTPSAFAPSSEVRTLQ